MLIWLTPRVCKVLARFTPCSDLRPCLNTAQHCSFYHKTPSHWHEISQTSRRREPAGLGPPTIHDEMDTRQPEQVLLDENSVAKSSGSSYLAVGTAWVRILTEMRSVAGPSLCAHAWLEQG